MRVLRIVDKDFELRSDEKIPVSAHVGIRGDEGRLKEMAREEPEQQAAHGAGSRAAYQSKAKNHPAHFVVSLPDKKLKVCQNVPNQRDAMNRGKIQKYANAGEYVALEKWDGCDEIRAE